MKSKLLTSIAALSLGISMASAQEIATWEGFRTSAATFTFDDCLANQYSTAVPLFDKYGYKASFYVVTNWLNSGYSNYYTWTNAQTLVNNGHEVGSHSDSHGTTMSDSEISSSKNTIDSKISGQTCNTVVYPNCNEPTESELAKYYIGGRICDGQVQAKTPSNYYRIGSIICGNTNSNCNTLDGFKNYFTQAINKQGWVVFLVHELDNGSGYSPLSSSVLSSVLSYVYDNDSKIWLTTFRNAILYSKERNAATITQISSSSTELVYSLTDNLDNDTYNYPLSIRVAMPDGWSDVVATQSDAEIESSVSDGYIYFSAVPDGGSIVLKSASAVTPDPTFGFTSPSSATTLCTDSSYTVSWSMSGDATGTYTLNWNTSGSSEVSISSVTASSEWTTEDGSFSWAADNVLSDDGSHGSSSRWGSVSGADEYLILNLSSSKTVGGVKIDEFTTYGTVSSFEIQYDDNGTWKTAYTGTTIGEDFSATFTPVTTSKIRFYINECGSGANINYIALTGVSAYELQTGITASGSYTWTPTSSMIGAGTLSICKSSGKALATSSTITIQSCGSESGSGSGSSSSTTTFACYDGNGYTGPSCDEEGTGAYHTGIYRNLFSEYLGKSDADVESKIQGIWDHFFTNGSSTSVYYETSDGMAYIYDTGNQDVRTEGMSYGLMICVQLNHQTEFDKIWKWAKKYMQYKSGDSREGLFAWQCGTDGTIKGTSCAPDGEAYFLTSLFFASHRWGNDGEINYEEEAQYLIKQMLNKSGRAAGTVSPIFNMSNYLITFGETSYGFTDPSYNLPGFLELWARWTDTNKEFWAKTADAARDLLYNSANSSTGLYPDYSTFDGSPYKPDWAGYDTQYYKYDAIRCPMNVGMDYHWFAKDSRQKTMIKNILNFFKNDGFSHGYFKVDGTDPSGSYSEGMSGANGVGVFALEDESLAKTYVEKLWNTTAPSGQWRYYNGMVYMLSMLHASGNFKIWKPAPAEKDTTIKGTGSVEFDGETYTESTNFCHFMNCTNYNVTIEVESSTETLDARNEKSVLITPNPADDQFAVVSDKEIAQITVTDMQGRELIIQHGSNTVATPFLSQGTYLVKITMQDNQVITKKLVIKR